MMNQVIFLYFAAVILVSAVLMITRRNPIHSVMFMLLLFFHIAGLFVLLNAEFLAAVQVIVYAGAILILYLFVVMLLNMDKEQLDGAVEPVLALDGGIRRAHCRRDRAAGLARRLSGGRRPVVRLAGLRRQGARPGPVSQVYGPRRDRVRDPAGGACRRRHAGEENREEQE